MRIEAFTTDPLSPSRSLRSFQATLHRLTTRDFLVTPRGPEQFRGSFRSHASRRHRFAEIAVSSHVGISRPVLSKPYLLALLNEGTAYVLQDGREAVLAPGQAVLVDTSRPLRIEATSLRASLMEISASQMREILPQVDGLTAIRIVNQAPAARILETTMRQLFAFPAETDDQVVDHVADAIPYLVAAALAELPAAKKAVPRPSEAYQRQRVLQFVRSRLRDKDLDPQMIAHALGLSARYVHKLFAGESVTLMQRVWNERLDRCHDELAAASLSRRSIAEIAYGWGFSQPAHFTRAFTARFGECPRTFRRKAVSISTRMKGRSRTSETRVAQVRSCSPARPRS